MRPERQDFAFCRHRFCGCFGDLLSVRIIRRCGEGQDRERHAPVLERIRDHCRTARRETRCHPASRGEERDRDEPEHDERDGALFLASMLT